MLEKTSGKGFQLAPPLHAVQKSTIFWLAALKLTWEPGSNVEFQGLIRRIVQSNDA